MLLLGLGQLGIGVSAHVWWHAVVHAVTAVAGLRAHRAVHGHVNWKREERKEISMMESGNEQKGFVGFMAGKRKNQ